MSDEIIELGTIRLVHVRETDTSKDLVTEKWIATGVVEAEGSTPNKALYALIDRYPILWSDAVDNFRLLKEHFGPWTDRQMADILKSLIKGAA